MTAYVSQVTEHPSCVAVSLDPWSRLHDTAIAITSHTTAQPHSPPNECTLFRDSHDWRQSALHSLQTALHAVVVVSRCVELTPLRHSLPSPSIESPPSTLTVSLTRRIPLDYEARVSGGDDEYSDEWYDWRRDLRDWMRDMIVGAHHLNRELLSWALHNATAELTAYAHSGESPSTDTTAHAHETIT